MPNLIAFAIPFFLALIGLELWVARRRGLAVYRFNDALVSISTGVTQQLALLFMKFALLGLYAAIYRHRLIDFGPSSAATWAIAIVGVDFTYYWWHRLSHQVNFLWAVHVVHHQSEDYNLATALRQAVLSPWTNLPFHFPLALLGVPPLVLVAADSISLLYQFWIHTELVGKLGWFERFFNTPSHHRVHHAINPQYLDKNYAAIFMFWDRMFGTLEVEEQRPVYGLVKGLRSHNPLWAQMHYWFDLARIARAAPRLVDRVRIWLEAPPWLPRGLDPYPPAPQVDRESFVKYDRPLPLRQQVYLLTQFVAVVGVTTWLLWFEGKRPLPEVTAAALLVGLALGVWGGMFDQRRWAIPAELARLFVTAVALGVWGAGHGALVPAALLGVGQAVVFGAWILACRWDRAQAAVPGVA